MRYVRKYIITFPSVLLLCSLLMVFIILGVTGCGGASDKDIVVMETIEESELPADESDETTLTPSDVPVPMIGMDMEELGDILGIDPEKLEDAFSQAMREAFSGEGKPDRQPPEGFEDRQPPEDFDREPPEFGDAPPENMPEGDRPIDGLDRQSGMSEEVLTRVAKILDISLQELEDAISQLGSHIP